MTSSLQSMSAFQTIGRAKTLDLIVSEPMRVLAAFAECHENFKHTALHLSMDARKVRERLHELNDVYARYHQSPLLRSVNSRAYELTSAGRELATFARQLNTDSEHMLRVLAGNDRIPIVTTSSGLPLYRQLQNALPPNAPYEVDAVPARSAEITVRDLPTDSASIFIFSMLFDAAHENVAVGRTRPLPGTSGTNREILVIRLDELKVVTNFALRSARRGATTPKDVLNEAFRFVTPGAGVPWDYLESTVDGWTTKSPQQHKTVPDLNFGLMSLGYEAAAQAMIVHGVTEERMIAGGLLGPHLYDLADTQEHQWRAATGIVRIKDQVKEHEQIWTAATRLWGSDSTSNVSPSQDQES